MQCNYSNIDINDEIRARELLRDREREGELTNFRFPLLPICLSVSSSTSCLLSTVLPHEHAYVTTDESEEEEEEKEEEEALEAVEEKLMLSVDSEFSGDHGRRAALPSS